MSHRSRSSLPSLLLLLCALAVPLRALAADESAASATPSAPRMRVVINADGTASVVPDTETPAAVSGLPDGVILPGLSDAASGLVPQWMLEHERAERQKQQEEQERLQREELQRQKQESETRAFAQAQEERKRRQREETEQDRQRASEAGMTEAEAAFYAAERRSKERQLLQLEQAVEAERQRGGEDSDAYRQALAALQSWVQREQQRDEQMRLDEIERRAAAASAAADAESAAAAERDRLAAADEIAAAAARAFAEAGGLVKVDDGSSQVAGHDPAQALFDALARSAFFRELAPHNAWGYVQAGRPFFMLLLCRCPADDMLDLATFENLLVDSGLHHRFSFLWAQEPTTSRFHMGNTYNVDLRSPQLVIDNIPIGQHVEKYVFSAARLARPATATPQDLLQFAQQFLQAPSPLTMVARSAPRPEQQMDIESDRGKVFEVVGDSFRELVLESSVSVLLMFYSPGCPGCISAQPVLTELAERLAWSNRGVAVARMDRTANDVPLVIRFHSYPAIFLFQAGMKLYDSASDGGEEIGQRGLRGSRGYRTPLSFHDEFPRGQEGSCDAPLNVADLEAFVQRNTRGGNLLGTPSQQPQTQQRQQSKPEEEPQQPTQQQASPPTHADPSTPSVAPHVEHATAAQHAGVSM